MKNNQNMYPPAGFCERLKTARKTKKYTQKELARKIDISIQSVKGYEGGWIIPTITICSKIAAELQVSLDWLVYGKENKDVGR